MKSKISLPDLPSALIRLALSDLKKVEKNRKYQVNMDFWHHPSSIFGDICYVCFAGAVMAQTCKIPYRKLYTPAVFDTAIRSKLFSLNAFRMGFLEVGLNFLGIKRKSKNVQVVHYKDNRIVFKKQMYQIARNFKRRGL